MAEDRRLPETRPQHRRRWIVIAASLGVILVSAFSIWRRSSPAGWVPDGYSDSQLEEIAALDVPAEVTAKKGSGIVVIKGSKREVEETISAIGKQLEPAPSK